MKASEDLDLLFLSKEDLYRISLDFKREIHELFESSYTNLKKLKKMVKKGRDWITESFNPEQGEENKDESHYEEDFKDESQRNASSTRWEKGMTLD